MGEGEASASPLSCLGRKSSSRSFYAEDLHWRLGLQVAGTYADRARSGATVIGRDGLLRLMEDARASKFDVVVVEALDRLSRDQEDLAGLYKRLSFAEIEIIAVHDGTADAIQVGIRGLVSSLFLSDLKHKIRRGMTGVVKDGRHAGGRAYGYRPTPGQPGVLQIFEPEAVIVRRIFTETVKGKSPREIAARLNSENVPAPRGERWNASTINGSRQRGNGILRNPLYRGQLVWNRSRMVRDPDTGRRVSRLNDASEIKSVEVPHLALVSPGIFGDANGARPRPSGEIVKVDRRHKRILSGLLKMPNLRGWDDDPRHPRISDTHRMLNEPREWLVLEHPKVSPRSGRKGRAGGAEGEAFDSGSDRGLHRGLQCRMAR
jgi:DNA invertase Pin-like site-specific DNA recombinase